MKKSKLVIALMAGLLISTCAITGSVAWFTANDDITNTFTVGKISMKLDESVLGGIGRTEKDQSGYKIIPGATITKDPRVTINKGSEKCYVFVCVENGLNQAIPDATQINIDKTKWSKLPKTSNIYQYVDADENGVIVDAQTAEQVLTEVFKTITIDGDKVTPANIDNLANKNIGVRAYAHQSENVTQTSAERAAIAYFRTSTN